MRDGLAAFPDAKHEVRQVVAEGDRVAVWGGFLSTFEGNGPASRNAGQKVDIEFAAIFRVEGDKIAEMRVTWDNQALQSQLSYRETK